MLDQTYFNVFQTHHHNNYAQEMHILKITVSTLQGQLHTCSEAEADAVLRANAACSELKSVKEVLQLFTEGHATSSNLLSAASDRIAATGREKADIQKTVERQYTAGKGLAQALNKLTLTSDSLKAQLAEAKLNIEDLQALLLQAASVSQVCWILVDTLKGLAVCVENQSQIHTLEVRIICFSSERFIGTRFNNLSCVWIHVLKLYSEFFNIKSRNTSDHF